VARTGRTLSWVVMLLLVACGVPQGRTSVVHSNDPDATTTAVTLSQLVSAADDWTKLAGQVSSVSQDVTDATTRVDDPGAPGIDVALRLSMDDQRAAAIVSDALSLPYIPTINTANMTAVREAIAQWGSAIHTIAIAVHSSDPVTMQKAIDRYNVSLAQYAVMYGQLYGTASPVLPMAVVPILPDPAAATATTVPPPTMTSTVIPSATAPMSTETPTGTATVSPTATSPPPTATNPPPTATVAIPTRTPTRPPATRTPVPIVIVTAIPLLVPTVTLPATVAAPRPPVTQPQRPAPSATATSTRNASTSTALPGVPVRTFYTSTGSTMRDIYCDTDPAWHRIARADLVAFPSLDSAARRYPDRALHEPC